MKQVVVLGLVVALLLVGGIGAIAKGQEKKVAISEVPEKAIAAAQKAVEGIKLEEAEVEEEDGVLVYELEGTVDGNEYEIEVTADGKVLEVEQEGEEDGEDDDDEDDD